MVKKRAQISIVGSTTKLLISETPPWSEKPYILKARPVTADNPTDLQLQQRLRLAEAAFNLYGQVRGKVMYKGKLMPAICARIAPQISGSIGGPERAQARREMRHEAARRHIEQMRAKLAEMGRGFGAYPPVTTA